MSRPSRRIKEDAWDKFGKNLLLKHNENATEEQISFLLACRKGKDSFLEYLAPFLEDENNFVNGVNPNPDLYLTENEFRYLPENTQDEIFKYFKAIPSEELNYTGFWGNVIIGLIERDRIKAHFLAAGNLGKSSRDQSGNWNIDYALNTGDKDIIDLATRRVLRSLCNPAPRGKRIIFKDFILGMSLWRRIFADRVSRAVNQDMEEVLSVLDSKVWIAISEDMHSGLSFISHQNILSGIVLYREQSPEITLKSFGILVKRLRYLSPWKAIEVQSPEGTKSDLELLHQQMSA